jgi:carbon-monoxide dehydrogenase large subunit
MSRYIGASIRRKEDTRLLTGHGHFVDDIDLPGMLHMAVYRAPHAHARLRSLDLSGARASDGVVAAWSYDDIAALARPFPMFLSHPSLKAKMYQALVQDTVRHVGEPVAVVAAADRYLAEDALAGIVVDYEPLPVVANLEQAMAPGAPLVYDDAPGNVAAIWIGPWPRPTWCTTSNCGCSVAAGIRSRPAVWWRSTIPTARP